jgi:hypothetical protein
MRQSVEVEIVEEHPQHKSHKAKKTLAERATKTVNWLNKAFGDTTFSEWGRILTVSACGGLFGS